MSLARSLSVLSGLALLAPGVASAAEVDWFPFAIPVFEDAAPAYDLSGLNEKPAGASGWIGVEGEHFVDGRGKPVRLFGGNLTAHACFPDPERAPAIARHLARSGCNVVRLHFLDNQWTWGGQQELTSLLTFANDPVRVGLNPEGIRRLDAFIAALKAEGVYVNVNLHVGREYPGSPKLTHNSKGVDQFMPDMIQGLKDYARILLTHVNPHTKLAYKDDPAVAILEISNEDSLVLNPWWIEQLGGPPRDELAKRWNAWLRKKYARTAALQSAWGVYRGCEGDDILPAGGLMRWRLEQNGGSQQELGGLPDGGVRWVATRAGAERWHLQLGSDRIAMREGQRYELTFKARSPTANELNVYCAQCDAPWNQLGFSTELKLGGDWQTFTYFISPGAVTTQSGARIVFSLLNRTGVVELASVQCRPVSSGHLMPGQTIEAGGLPLPKQGDPRQVREDFFRFLADVEVDFGREIARFLKQELGCRALVADSQVLFGGPMGARREWLVSDFVDTHGYWHHPSWPRRQWDPRDWSIVNESQIGCWDGGTLAEMAMQRPSGKPYTVSEYDLPAPTDYAAEMWPMLAAMASFQDWSALYHYTFAHRLEEFGADHITGYFNEFGHPAKAGLRPAAAVLYRLGLIAPARETVSLRLGDEALLDQATQLNGQMWGAWRMLWDREAKLNGSLALRHRVGLSIEPERKGCALAGMAPVALASPHEADTGEWTWDTAKGVFLVGAPAARIWCGALGGAEWAAGDASLKVSALAAPAPHATVVLVALDGQPVRESKRLLLTALRRAENEGMGFNADRTSVSDQWGHGPARVLGLSAQLRLPAGAGWKVETLDPAGRARRTVAEAATEVQIDPRAQTIWWMLTRK